MPLLAAVQEYIDAAIKRAVPEQLEDGTIAATVPECFGVVAFGADLQECGENLYARLEDYVRVSLSNGLPLPVIDGIDLNVDAAQHLTADRTGAAPSGSAHFFENEQAFEAALSAWDKNH